MGERAGRVGADRGLDDFHLSGCVGGKRKEHTWELARRASVKTQAVLHRGQPSRKVSSPRPSSVLLVHHRTSGDWLHHEGNDLRGEGSGQEGPCSVLSTFRQWSHRAGYTVHALSIKGLGAQCARRGCPRPVWKRILTGTYVDDAIPPEEGRWLPAQARPHPSDLSPPT